MVEVAGGDEAVAAVVAWAAGDEDAGAFVEGVEFEDWGGGLVWWWVDGGWDGS